ncbi:MAG: OmpA family protein [Syntrophales bacterium]|nr:OmpA family protein [Syntrophales bacterium]
MKRNSIFVGLLVLIFGLSLLFVSGCATDQAVKSETIKTDAIQADASMKDILADETAKSKAGWVAFQKEEAARKMLLAEAAAFKDIQFAFDRYDLSPEARNMLGGLADWMSKQAGWVLTIEGHSDNRGTLEYNLALGERRAEAAKTYLTGLGLAEKRVTTISYGEEMPLDPANNEAAWAKNRRDHFLLVLK